MDTCSHGTNGSLLSPKLPINIVEIFILSIVYNAPTIVRRVHRTLFIFTPFKSVEIGIKLLILLTFHFCRIMPVIKPMLLIQQH